MDEKRQKRVKKQTKKFMDAVKLFLKSKNGGEIPSEWGCSLLMLETYYSQFIMLTYEIEDLPSLVIDTRYGAAPSPLLKAQSSAAVRLESLLKQMGLTMKSASGMDIIEVKPEESTLEKFVRQKTEKKGK